MITATAKCSGIFCTHIYARNTVLTESVKPIFTIHLSLSPIPCSYCCYAQQDFTGWAWKRHVNLDLSAISVKDITIGRARQERAERAEAASTLHVQAASDRCVGNETKDVVIISSLCDNDFKFCHKGQKDWLK